MQWLKLPAWKVGGRGLEPLFGIQVTKKQNVSSLLTRKDSILWGAYVTDVNKVSYLFLIPYSLFNKE